MREQERRAERCRASVKRLMPEAWLRHDALCRQVRPALRVALALPAGSCWKHAFSMTRASTVSMGYAFRRAPAGPARARAMTLREPVRKAGWAVAPRGLSCTRRARRAHCWRFSHKTLE